MSHADVQEELNTWYDTAKSLKQRYLNSTSAIERKAIAKEFNQCKIYPYLDNHNIDLDFKRNTFALINRFNKERIKEYYTDSEKLHQAYLKSNYFNLKFIDKIDHSIMFSFDFSPKDLAKKINNTRTSQKHKINAILDLIDNGIPRDIILAPLNSATTPVMYSNVANILEAVAILGIDTVRNQSTFKAIEKKLDAVNLYNLSELKRFSRELITALHIQFANRLNTPIPKTEIQQIMQTLYNNHSIISKNGKPFKVTQTTISDYYTANINNQKRTCTLFALLPHLNEKIQAN